MATKNYTTKPLEQEAASGGNRTPGRCLEGVYVTTTPLKLTIPPPRFERRSSDSKSDVITNYTMGESKNEGIGAESQQIVGQSLLSCLQYSILVKSSTICFRTLHWQSKGAAFRHSTNCMYRFSIARNSTSSFSSIV